MFDLRLGHADWDVDFHVGPDPRLGYVFDVQEWIVSLGYVIAFGG